jgi:hypothetical protein
MILARLSAGADAFSRNGIVQWLIELFDYEFYALTDIREPLFAVDLGVAS